MDKYLIDVFINLFSINIGIQFCLIKLNNTAKLSKKQILFITLINIILTVAQLLLKNSIPTFYRIILTIFAYSILYRLIFKSKLIFELLISTISLSITYISNILSSLIIAAIFHNYYFKDINNIIPVLFYAFLTILFTFSFFSIKRFKNGFPFLQKLKDNDYFSIFLLIISSIIIFMYILCMEYTKTPLYIIIIGCIFFMIIMLIIIQKSFVLYHKQKLQLKALKDYEQELSETKQKLETAISEKTNLVRSNHEFYQRQKALNKKLDDLLILQAHSSDVELGEEIGDIISRIDKMTDEYKAKTHTLPNLVKSNIKEIDDMFSYMQYECYKNNIDFILNFNCDIQYIIDNSITQTQFVTLLGDLISNSIIAINHSSNIFRSIMIVLGIKDNSYELCVFDSGIAFEISTLINLGLKPASTHLDEGGSGSGFITTFETINSCNASFIINEVTGTNYTKSLTIKFDGKNDYIIISDRADKINEINVDNRIIKTNKTP